VSSPTWCARRCRSGDDVAVHGLRRAAADDSGSVTVEFALVAPVVVVVLATVVAALGVATEAVRLADAAGIAARALGRGDDGLAARIVGALAPGATTSVDRGDLVCVRLERAAALGPVAEAVPLSAHSCAPEGGR
jgi:hypothetical protein